MREAKREKRKKKHSGFRYRKAALIITLLILVVVPLIGTVTSSGYGAKYDKGVIEEYGNPEAKEPKLTADAAMLYSLELNKPLLEKNPDKKIAPYSITKLLTCYLALEKLGLDDTIKISKNATRELKDGMEMELEPGDRLTARDLIYASMMMSANDAAIAIGEAAGGSEKDFVKMMNDQAKKWGCENTNFVNTNGWDHKKHYTTARDMAIITRKCLEDPTLRSISLKKRYTAKYLNKDDDLFMINAFLNTTEGISNLTGGKTGTWTEDDCSIALEFNDQGQSGVIVLLGDTKDGRTKDIRKLMEYAHDAAEGFVMAKMGKTSFEARIKGGSDADLPLYTMKTIYAYPESGKSEDVKVTADIKKTVAPISKGDKVGIYEVEANDKLITRGYLYAAKDVKKGMFLSRFYISDNATWLILALIFFLNLQGFIMDKRSSKES